MSCSAMSTLNERTEGREGWSSLRCRKLTAQPGKRDALVALLRRHAKELEAVGCEYYEVRPSKDDPDVVWVTEAWPSAKARLASFGVLAVRRSVVKAVSLMVEVPE